MSYKNKKIRNLTVKEARRAAFSTYFMYVFASAAANVFSPIAKRSAERLIEKLENS